MLATRLESLRSSFWAKVVAAVALIALADLLFDGWVWPGATVGVFALAWTVTLVGLNPAVRCDPRAWVAASVAAALALVQIEDPGLVAWGLFWIAIGMAALLPRAGPFDDAWRWARRLAVHALSGIARPVRDLCRVRRRLPKSARGRLRGLAPALVLPALGGVVFLALFAAANPIIADALRNARGPTLGVHSLLRAGFWSVVLVAVWATLRPRLGGRRGSGLVERPIRSLPGVSVASVTLSLLVFNGLFLLQNGLDLAYLWSGAGLPEGMTLAEYAHQGAYPLIATALLAGLFVLVALRPGTATAESFAIRRLVVLWIAQNVFLVASTALRTLDYIDAYSLTRMRISALAWMALVAVGLMLIGWRLLRGKSTAWLINANALAALSVLAASTVVDVGAAAAAWNVRHARDVGGRGAELDLCYLSDLGGSGLAALAELEGRPIAPELRERVAAVRLRGEVSLRASQADWRSWTWRGARRLQRVEALTSSPAAPIRPGARECDGRLIPPSPAPALRPAPQVPPSAPPSPPAEAGPLTPASQP